MITRPDKYGYPISQLGFGCMRLPSDKQAAEKLLVKAVELGVS